ASPAERHRRQTPELRVSSANDQLPSMAQASADATKSGFGSLRKRDDEDSETITPVRDAPLSLEPQGRWFNGWLKAGWSRD
ncbi:hypothetical protein, partial [Streptomyces telluris]|uniref:hypothetical protein n=1 Tax=Streptomyces telluris TaxID=2720021 RepID=UPI0019D0BC7D